MSRVYAMESRYLSRLQIDRREIIEIAKSLTTAEAMRTARTELLSSASVNVAPKNGEQVKYTVVDGVAQIPIVGQLTPKAETDACGAYTAGTLTEYGFIQAALIAAEDDPAVREIAFNVNSPGGYLDGLDETAQLIAAVTKPTTAYVSDMAASAAYWLASQADKIVALSPASEIGSIGVAVEEYDNDAMLQNQGITHRTYTSTGAPNKRPDTKTEEGRAKIVENLDALHEIFIRRVAEGRGVSTEKVHSDFGQGGVMTAESAMAAGMIDEVRGVSISRKIKTAGVAGGKTAGSENKTEVEMTEQEIEALKADAYQAGKQAEQKRVADLQQYSGKFGASVDAIVSETLANGKTLDDVKVQLDVAVMQSKSAGENAPDVATGAAINAANTIDTRVAGMSDQDVKQLLAAGLTIEQIKANAPKGV